MDKMDRARNSETVLTEGVYSPELIALRDAMLNAFEVAMRKPARETLNETEELDGIVVFEGNTVIHEKARRIKPTAFRHSDKSPLFDPSNFAYIMDVRAMLGGGLRPMAAAQIATGLGEKTPPLIFVGGNSGRKETTHGVRHSGAEIYMQRYQHWLEIYRSKADKRGGTEIVDPSVPANPTVRDDSEHSRGDIESALENVLMRKPSGDIRLGFLSNEYHLPRLQAIFESIQAADARFLRVSIVPVSAERTVLSLASAAAKEEYLKIISAAYRQPEALDRMAVEIGGTEMTKWYRYNPRPGKAVGESTRDPDIAITKGSV